MKKDRNTSLPIVGHGQSGLFQVLRGHIKGCQCEGTTPRAVVFGRILKCTVASTKQNGKIVRLDIHHRDVWEMVTIEVTHKAESRSGIRTGFFPFLKGAVSIA